MKNFFSSRTIQAAIIGGIALVIATVLSLGFQKPADTIPLVSQQANNNASSSVTQIVNVNREATYSLEDANEWKRSLAKDAEGNYQAHITFIASDGILPSLLCFHFKTDGQFLRVVQDQEGFLTTKRELDGTVNVCISSPLKEQGFEFSFKTKPNFLQING